MRATPMRATHTQCSFVLEQTPVSFALLSLMPLRLKELAGNALFEATYQVPGVVGWLLKLCRFSQKWGFDTSAIQFFFLVMFRKLV